MKWALIAVLWLTYFLNYVDRQVIFSLLPALRAEIAMSNLELGFLGSLFIWFYSLASPLGGRLADRYGPERVIVASLLLWSGATLGTGLSGSVVPLLFWRAMTGVTEALYFPAAVSLLGAVHPQSMRSRAISLHGSAQFAGIAAGGWFGGWMAEQFGWRSGFWYLAAGGVLWSVPLWMALRLSATRTLTERRPGRLADLRSQGYVALSIAFFGVCVMLWMLYAWLPLFLHERYGLSLSQSGLHATIFLQLGSLAGILAGGVAGDWASKRHRLGRLGLVGGGLLLAAPFAVWVLSARELQTAETAAAAFGVFTGIMLSNTMAAAYDMVPERSYGLAAGILTMVGGSAGGLAILFAGAWKDTYGIEALMRWGAAGAAAAALLLLISARKQRPPQQKKTE